MTAKRKRHSADFKAKVAIEEVRGIKTVNELAKEFSVHPTQVSHWRREFPEGAKDVFKKGKSKPSQEDDAPRDKLYQEIGELKVELDFLKKNRGNSAEDRRELIERGNPRISVRRQCEPLRAARSSVYYRSAKPDESNLEIAKMIDRQYTETPFYGSRETADWLRRQGVAVKRKRVRRVMRKTGLEAVYPRPKTSKPNPENRVYPYLLRDLKIERPDQVRRADIWTAGADSSTTSSSNVFGVR